MSSKGPESPGLATLIQMLQAAGATPAALEAFVRAYVAGVLPGAAPPGLAAVIELLQGAALPPGPLEAVVRSFVTATSPRPPAPEVAAPQQPKVPQASVPAELPVPSLEAGVERALQQAAEQAAEHAGRRVADEILSQIGAAEGPVPARWNRPIPQVLRTLERQPLQVVYRMNLAGRRTAMRLPRALLELAVKLKGMGWTAMTLHDLRAAAPPRCANASAYVRDRLAADLLQAAERHTVEAAAPGSPAVH